MPIYMDLHIIPGANAKDVAAAHTMDVFMEKDHSCKCITYWIDESRGQIFCLIDAPSKENVQELHSRSHGMVPHKIIEVESEFVQSFLGRIADPQTAARTDDGLLLINDPAFRILLMIPIPDPVLMDQDHPPQENITSEEIQNIRHQFISFDGCEATYKGNAIIGSFTSAQKAWECALKIFQTQRTSYPIYLHAGNPVGKTNGLFGESIQLLQRMHYINRAEKIIISIGVKELLSNEPLINHSLYTLSAKDELLLNSLFDILEKKYCEPDLQVENYAQQLAMSQSQFYRKVTALTGYTPNDLMKEYRLQRSKDMLRLAHNNVSEIGFQTGFTSASYFTKCFRKRFGLTPLSYQQLAQ